ncbi:hypothetical protein BDZ97DRAFT_2044723, partial [Flammula alnicola]
IVPAELCEVEHGQLFKRKVPENITVDVVKFSTIRPQERLKKITEGVIYLFFSFLMPDRHFNYVAYYQAECYNKSE